MTSTPLPGPGHTDHRVPDRTVCVLRYLLDRMAKERGEQVYAVFDDDTSWTYNELREQTISVAVGLQKLGGAAAVELADPAQSTVGAVQHHAVMADDPALGRGGKVQAQQV